MKEILKDVQHTIQGRRRLKVGAVKFKYQAIIVETPK